MPSSAQGQRVLSKRLNSLQVNRCPSLQKELMRYLSWGWQATFRGGSLTPLNLWPLTAAPLLASSLGKVSGQILSPSAQKPPGPRGPVEPPPPPPSEETPEERHCHLK